MKTIAQIIGIVVLLFAIDYYLGTNAFGLLLDSISKSLGQIINDVIDSITKQIFDSIMNQLGV